MCQTRVCSNAIFCGSCKRCLHKKCSVVALRDPCALTLSSGAPDTLGQLCLLMEEKIHRLMLKMTSLNSATLGAGSLQEATATWPLSHAAKVPGAIRQMLPFLAKRHLPLLIS